MSSRNISIEVFKIYLSQLILIFVGLLFGFVDWASKCQQNRWVRGVG